MASVKSAPQIEQLINTNLVDFQPEEYEKIKATLLRRIDVVARSFCETEYDMMRAIKHGDARIGTVSDNFGRFCIFIEYRGTQVLKPVHVLH